MWASCCSHQDRGKTLIGSLALDFAFVRLCGPTGYQAVEVIRGDRWKGFLEWLQQRFVRFGQVSRTETVTNVGGVDKSCCGVVILIGVNSERGLIAAACDRSGFPNQIDQQLLSVAGNNAATAFQNARLIDELRTAQKALSDREQELSKARATVRLGPNVDYRVPPSRCLNRLVHNITLELRMFTRLIQLSRST